MFAKETYVSRRRALAEELSGGIVLLPGNFEAPINYPDNCYPYRQDSTFLYYFGHSVPGMAGTLDLETGEAFLWGNDATMDDIIWTGPLPTVAERAERIGAAGSGSMEELVRYVEHGVSQGRKVNFRNPYRAETRAWQMKLFGLSAAAMKRETSIDLSGAVIKQRSVKTPEEVAEIEKALDISHDMYAAAMQMARPGVPEREIAGTMAGIAARADSLPAFRTILTVNGEILHNHSHGNILREGRMLLIDSGVESPEHYASDITRSLPVGGRFTPRQRELYQILHDAQVSAISRCTPGVPFLDVHLHTARMIAEGLKNLGLMKGNMEDAVREGAHALFFPHGLGHMLGLDAHDLENFDEDLVGYGEGFKRSDQFGLRSLRLARPLREGFVVTVEPGIYFIPALVEKWRAEGLHSDFVNYPEVEKYLDFGGMRLEDDILVTSQGPRVLGKPIPKTIDEIEAAMA